MRSFVLELLTFNFIGLISNLPLGKNIEEEENFEVSFDVVQGDGLNEETVIFGQPREEPKSRISKFNRLMSKRKRGLVRSKKSTNTSDEGDYDYDEQRRAYYGELYAVEKEGLVYNYTDHKKGEETVGDSIHSITNFKDQVNCSLEENRNIGFQAVHCLWQDYWHAKAGIKSTLLMRAMEIVTIWIAIYLLIVIPMWCIKGWCCCCCPCRLCHPRRVVLQAKKFMYENKPGEIVHSNGETEYYEPTKYEKEAYHSLKHMIKTV